MEDTTKYWKERVVSNETNSPNKYAAVNENRGKNITDAFEKIKFTKESSILEMGCNVGRNLNFLLKNGFKNLTGVEICPEAINLGKEIYPNLFNLQTFNIFNERCSDFVNNNNNKYDIAFTMAVLMHIDDDERELFYDFLKKNVKYAVFIENSTQEKYVKGGRLFNKADYELQMKKKGFITIHKTKQYNEHLKHLKPSYFTIVFKNINLSE